MPDLPPPEPPDEPPRADPPSWPTGPPGPSTPAPASTPTPTPRSTRGPWIIIAAVTGLALMGLVVAALFTRSLVADGTLTAHIDRANDYLETVRVDSAAAALAHCPGAEITALAELSATTGQYLSSFDVENTDGVVTGRVSYADGSTRSITIHTMGPTFPGGELPMSQVCIDAVRLD